MLYWNSSVGHGLWGRLWNHGNNLIHSFLCHFSVFIFHHPGHTSGSIVISLSFHWKQNSLQFDKSGKMGLVWLFFFLACLNIRWQKGLLKKNKINSSPWTQGGAAGREKALLAQSPHFPFLSYFSIKMLGENLLPAFPQSCILFCLAHGLDQGPHTSKKLGVRLRPLPSAFPKDPHLQTWAAESPGLQAPCTSDMHSPCVLGQSQLPKPTFWWMGSINEPWFRDDLHSEKPFGLWGRDLVWDYFEIVSCQLCVFLRQ